MASTVVETVVTTLRFGSSCVIGRKAVADVLISHESVSGKHCTIKIQKQAEELDKRGDTSRLRASIIDHSSNGTWVSPSLHPNSPYRLVKGVVTSITVGDSIFLLNPKHPQSCDYHLTLEKGTMGNELVLCKTMPSRLQRKRSIEIDDHSIPLAKICKIMNKHENKLEKHRDDDVVITSITGTRLCPPGVTTPPITVTSSTPTVRESSSGECLPLGTGMNQCTFCGKLFPVIELENHTFECHVKGQFGNTSITATPSTPATPTLTTPISTAPYPSPDLEQCPKCLSVFSICELVSHVEKCASPTITLEDEEEKEHCQFCMKMFPVVELVSHAITCNKQLIDNEADCIISSVTQTTDSITDNTVIASPSIYTTITSGDTSVPSTAVTTTTTTVELISNAASSSGEPPLLLSKAQSQEQCPKCLDIFTLSELITHYDTCNVPIESDGPAADDKDHCEFCLRIFPVSELIFHAKTCTKAPLNSLKYVNKVASSAEDDPIERCMKCFCDFPISQLVKHSSKCEGEMLGPSTERFKEFLPSIHDVDAMALSVLTPTQQCAMDYVREQSKSEASDRYPELCMRIIKLGYTPKDLQRVLHWVRHDAPIIIHLNLNRSLQYLIKDTHYRNLFETHTSGGSSSFGGRKGWEDRIFNKIYYSSSPMEKVKYGVLNIVGDPAGVRCCYSYGDSFLQLKKVRLRTTFASMDTSSPSVKLSCCEHYGNVLHEYSDAELIAILDVATRKKPYLKSTMIINYKEVQIHGPVCLSENVDCIVVNHRHRGDRKMEEMLDKFVERNGCNMIWMDDHHDYDEEEESMYYD